MALYKSSIEHNEHPSYVSAFQVMLSTTAAGEVVMTKETEWDKVSLDKGFCLDGLARQLQP